MPLFELRKQSPERLRLMMRTLSLRAENADTEPATEDLEQSGQAEDDSKPPAYCSMVVVSSDKARLVWSAYAAAVGGHLRWNPRSNPVKDG